MKLLLPVAVMTVASGICCCGGGDMESMMEEIQEKAEDGASTTVTVDGDGAAKVETTEASSGSTASTGGSSEGVCGRFKDDGFTYPSGLSVVACANSAGSESLVLQGSGNPAEICKGAKAWATGKGWSVTTEAEMMGTSSIIMKNSDKQLTVACTDMGGQTTLSMSISQGY